MRVIALLGGTFDPVHYGHLRIGLEIFQCLQADELRFIPCADPPHRPPAHANASHRAAMLEVAVSGLDFCSVDKREFARKGPSYTIDTLREIRKEVGNEVSLCWIVGSDSFQSLNTWHEWENLLDFAHFTVACRPGWQRDTDSDMGQKLADCFVDDPLKLHEKPAGYIMPWSVTQLSISATKIRQMLKDGNSTRFLMPDAVNDYIEDNRLYR